MYAIMHNPEVARLSLLEMPIPDRTLSMFASDKDQEEEWEKAPLVSAPEAKPHRPPTPPREVLEQLGFISATMVEEFIP